MSTPIPSSKGNPCHVCDDITGTCRQGRDDLTYWLCKTYPDTPKGKIENGYKCLGQSKNSQWAKVKHDNTGK